ncbi:uncharacterized protein LOC116308661 isoform X2 [Actinia tenebrosa]|uniref:Uncharacterized protein LOC116293425 n=1 Tax=Actinia tenebrosa TaxID=6105 RepID=A0A6P8HVU0_ACTTE|nr:uncharacterized protein LOC116293425 [Actinia tenebrosa]XP_031575005.1 uncharacterized protein LOC116308661 isoform X2 [Actinia tenebrosa]
MQQTMSGVLGIAALCKRGQCAVMSFMVFCILTCLSSAEFLVVGVFSWSPIWTDTMFPLIGKKTKVKESLSPYFFGWISGFAFTFLLALIGSILSCVAKCKCCERQNPNVEGPERFIIPASAVAPAVDYEMQEITVM